jgi:pyruvate,water dikinase
MAGQFESVLDVRTWGELLAAVRAVVASADGGPMAVLVQPFVVPAWGGVMFGADPVSGRTDRLVVSAVPGGPHRLVSGEVDGTQMTLSPHRHTSCSNGCPGSNTGSTHPSGGRPAWRRGPSGPTRRLSTACVTALPRRPSRSHGSPSAPTTCRCSCRFLLGAGVVFSALPWVVERVARVAARPAAERRLARKLDTLTLPPGGLLPPAEQPPDLFSPLRRKLVGCLGDSTIERLQGHVASVETIEPERATPD